MSIRQVFTNSRAAALAAGFAAFVAASTAWALPEIGAPAPDFTGIDSKGNKVSLSDFKGKTVILEWTNDGCPYVQKHYRTSNMQKLQKTATGDGIVWLSIISSAPGTQGHVNGAEADELTTSRNAAPTAVVLDPKGEIGQLYGAQVTPHMYIIKKDGTLAYKGAIDSVPSARDADLAKATNYVTNALRQISEGQDVNPAVTRPYGCSVKYKS